MECLNRQFRVVGGFFRRISCYDSPVHPPAASREQAVHVQHAPEVPWIRQSQWSNRDMRLDGSAVVAVTSDLANVPVAAGQEQFPLVLTNNPRGMIVLQSHWPEGLRADLVQPVRIAAHVGSQVNMKCLSIRVVAERNGSCIQVNVPHLRRNRVRRERRQSRSVGLHLIQSVLAQEHDPSVHFHPALRADDPYRFRDSPERPVCRWVAMNHPQAAPRAADQVGVQAWNHRLRLRAHIGRQ